VGLRPSATTEPRDAGTGIDDPPDERGSEGRGRAGIAAAGVRSPPAATGTLSSNSVGPRLPAASEPDRNDIDRGDRADHSRSTRLDIAGSAGGTSGQAGSPRGGSDP
jgi:hypothetical protein